MQSSASGFRNAPVTKGLMLLTGGMSVLVGVTNALPHLKLSSLMDQVLANGQVWRLATNHLFFTSPGELLLGLILFYYFRLFERQMSSTKFGAFAFLSYVLSTLLELAYLALFHPAGEFVSGPYGFLFASLVLYYTHVPATSRFRFLGVNLSDKFFVYLLAAQLFNSHAPTSFVAALSGILVGLAYRSPALQLSSFTLPRVVNNLCATLLLPLLKSSDPRRTRNGARRARPAGGRQPPAMGDAWPGATGLGGAAAAFGGNPGAAGGDMDFGGAAEPSEDAIRELTSMGFARPLVIQALRAAQNDPAVAADLLLNQFQ